MGDPLQLHQTAAEFLAKATLDLFPKTLLLGGQGTTRYFYYDFILPFPANNDILPLIQERLIFLIKNQNVVAKREMIPSNASQLFSSRGQIHIAEKMHAIEGLVQICQVGDFLDYCPNRFSLTWPFIPHLKLFAVEELSCQKIRIIGALSSEKKTLKACVKSSSPGELNHAHFLSNQKLFASLEKGLWMWLPKATIVRQLLIHWWQNETQKRNFRQVQLSHGMNKEAQKSLARFHRECFFKYGYQRLAEMTYVSSEKPVNDLNGLFETKGYFTDRLTQFFSEENFLQACISSLQFILEMPKILGFEPKIVLGLSTAKTSNKSGKRADKRRLLQVALEKLNLNYAVEKHTNVESEMWIDVMIPDALGRLWSGPYMSIPPQEGSHSMLVCSVFGSMERLIGLILEHHAGNFPFWLAPEQVRLIALSEEVGQYAQHVHQQLKSAAIRSEVDGESSGLAQRLYQAIVEKIPFAVIIGDKELETQTLVVRALGSEKEERMHVNALCERIKTLKSGSQL